MFLIKKQSSRGWEGLKPVARLIEDDKPVVSGSIALYYGLRSGFGLFIRVASRYSLSTLKA